VHTDQKRLRQILINLLSNAIKYTEAGHASLIVRYRSEVAEFEVSDTGIGIHQSDLERIFEPFERGRDPAVRALPGTGLGLTITKLLTQIMGGELLVRSVPGAGSTLTCRLLLSEASHDPAVADQPRLVRGYTGQRRTILLADDDPSHLDLIRELLATLGFTVVLAANGHTCLEMAALHKPDLVLLDISLPDMTGWEVAQALRRTEEAERGPGPWSEESAIHMLKVIMVSANAHEYRPGADGASPHDGFIMKPVELESLLTRSASSCNCNGCTSLSPPRPRKPWNRCRNCPALPCVIWMRCISWAASATCAASRPSFAKSNIRTPPHPPWRRDCAR